MSKTTMAIREYKDKVLASNFQEIKKHLYLKSKFIVVDVYFTQSF